MAGGRGERFWPKSRASMPKQFLSLTDDGKTMIRLTAERHLSIVPWEDMFVVTNKDYIGLVREQLPEIPPENILAEPMAKNTAPCIGYAATVIRKKYGDAVMLVLASDHLIQNARLYLDTMAQAVEVALEGDNLATVGITPSYPETGYGYIHFGSDGEHAGHKGVYAVRRFVEKPDLETAKGYLASGDYLWNSGMFVWKASSILSRFERLMPQVYEDLCLIENSIGKDSHIEVLRRCFERFPSISIDYGIMEKADNIYTLPGAYGWDDVGSWLALERINPTDSHGNYLQGNVLCDGTRNSIVVGADKLIAAVDLEEMVVVDTKDAMLICRKESVQNVKKIIEHLRASGRSDLI